MTDLQWRAMIEARLANLERQTGVERDRTAEDAAVRAAAGNAVFVLPAPLPVPLRHRAAEGGPTCPATLADDAELDRRLQAFLDIPATEP